MSLAERKKKEKSVGLFEKIQKIQSEAEESSMDTTVTIGSRSFKAASLDSVLTTYLPLLKKYKMSMVLIRQEILPPAAPNNFLMNSTYSLVDIETGESHDFNVHSNGQSGDDKGTGKAASYALKIAFLQIFCGRRGDDPDTETNDRQTAVRSGGKPSKPEQPKQEPPKQESPKVPPDESPLAKACASIKRKFDIHDIATSQNVPSWSEVESFAKTIKADQATVDNFLAFKANIIEFARYWWLCCHVSGSKNLKDTEAIFAKAKGKLTVKQREAIEGMIAKRRAAAVFAEREPGEEG